MIFHENRCQQTILMVLWYFIGIVCQQTNLMIYQALFVILKKRQDLKLSSAANYRWRFKGLDTTLCLIQCFETESQILVKTRSLECLFYHMTSRLGVV